MTDRLPHTDAEIIAAALAEFDRLAKKFRERGADDVAMPEISLLQASTFELCANIIRDMQRTK